MEKYILAPFDGSKYAERGLEWAIEQYPDARITVLSVVDPLSKVGQNLSDAPLDTEAGNAAPVHSGGLEAIDRFARDWDADIRTVVVAGTPAEANYRVCQRT